MPSFWLELNCRRFGTGARKFLAVLKDPRYAQVESFTLPEDLELTEWVMRQIIKRLPRVKAFFFPPPFFEPPVLDIVMESYAQLLQLHLQDFDIDAKHLRFLLEMLERLRVLECRGNWLSLELAGFRKEAGQMVFDPHQRVDVFATHEALQELSLHYKDLSFLSGDSPPDFRFHALACCDLVRCVLYSLPNLSRLCLNGWKGLCEDNVDDIIEGCFELRELQIVDVPVGSGRKEVTRNRDQLSRFPRCHP